MFSDDSKTVQKYGHVFRVRKFTPAVGGMYANQLFGSALGGLIGLQGEAKTQAILKAIQDFTQMGPEQYQAFQDACLSFVDVQIDGKFLPLVQFGSLAVTDLKAHQVYGLTLESFTHSIMDFLLEALNAGGEIMATETAQEPILQKSPSSNQTETLTTGSGISSGRLSGLDTGNSGSFGMGHTL